MSDDTQEYGFTTFDSITGRADLDGARIIDFLARYTPDYRISSNMMTLEGLGQGVASLRERQKYDLEYGKAYLAIFKRCVIEDSEDSNARLSKEAIRRYMVVAREYLGTVGGLGLN